MNFWSKESFRYRNIYRRHPDTCCKCNGDPKMLGLDSTCNFLFSFGRTFMGLHYISLFHGRKKWNFFPFSHWAFFWPKLHCSAKVFRYRFFLEMVKSETIHGFDCFPNSFLSAVINFRRAKLRQYSKLLPVVAINIDFALFKSKNTPQKMAAMLAKITKVPHSEYRPFPLLFSDSNWGSGGEKNVNNIGHDR